MRRSLASIAIITICVAACAVGTWGEEAKAPAQNSAKGWWFQAGPVYRGGMDMEVGGRTYVQELALHAAEPYRRRGVGPADEFANRNYDDGYVNIDALTQFDGLTWFWGYENNDQYESIMQGIGTLSFHKRGVSLTRETLVDEEIEDDDNLESVGAALTIGKELLGIGTIEKAKFLGLDLCLGIQGLWGADSEIEATPYRERYEKRQYLVTDTYSDITMMGVPVDPPTAPYAQDFNGAPLLITIPNIPDDRRTRTTARETWEAEAQLDMDIEAALYNVWVGPRLVLETVGGVNLFVNPNISANYVDVDVERNEEFVKIYSDGRTEVLQSWRDEESEGKWRFGVGVIGGLQVNLNETWFATAFGAYDWIEEEVEVPVGPNTITIDPSGYSAGVEIGKKL